MSLVLKSTPLAAISAIALDTETTGLDIKSAHVIELAAVPVEADGSDGPVFSSFVACPVPVPASATAIHGLTDADLAGAPPFRDVWQDFFSFAAGRPWVGYAIGFDAGVLRRSCLDAGLSWHEPATLDVRLLAQALSPQLPDFSLDALCDWLGISADNRHRALADAAMAQQIFIALLPRLRAKGIVTVGDAIGLCRRLSEGSAWPINTSLETAGAAAGTLERRDTYPYRHRVRDVMSKTAHFMPPDTGLIDAIRTMNDQRVSSVYVGTPQASADQVAILTERDAMRALARGGAAALERPISAFATSGLETVASDAFIYRAVGRMARRKIRHLAVTGEAGTVVGALSARDLLRLRASAAVELGDDIDVAADVGALGRAWAKIPAMAQALMDEDMPARDVAGIIAAEVCAATARAAGLAEQAMEAEGKGKAPCPYAVLALGSAGRGESLLAMDQDNALVFESGEPGGPEDAWFFAFGTRMNDILDRIGIPLCKGGVMASQPSYRGSEATWRARVRHWVTRSNPSDLLAVDICFDMRAVHGAEAMANRLRADAWAAAQPQKAFLKLLASNGEGAENPVGFMGGWKTGPDNRIDMKNAGLRRVVSAARVLAIGEGHLAFSTHDRLNALAATREGATTDIEDLDRAHATVLDTILRQQLADLRNGVALSNRIDPANLDRLQTRRLKAAISHMKIVNDLVRDRLIG
ncbi:MAG: DUF294 nucleotidyltransferase-like domain-containing protein [Beijerinckiaceae bacterium]